MRCEFCQNTPVTRHHIIFRNKTQCGLDVEENIIYLCFNCHYSIHHGKDIDKKNKILKLCYDKIRNNIDKCWSSKVGIKPKIVRLIEQGDL